MLLKSLTMIRRMRSIIHCFLYSEYTITITIMKCTVRLCVLQCLIHVHVHVHVLYMYMYCTCTCTVHVYFLNEAANLYYANYDVLHVYANFVPVAMVVAIDYAMMLRLR